MRLGPLLLVGAAALGGCVRGGRSVRPLALPATPPDDAPTDVPAPGTTPVKPLEGGDDLPYFADLLGKAPPPLAGGGRWLRADRRLTLESLRGRVVLLHFAFLKCPACSMVAPALERWRLGYAAEGLSVLYVDNGRRDTRAEAEAAVRDGTLPFAVYHDATEAATIAYAVRAYPTSYLIDRAGKVVWQGVAVGAEEALEAAIRAALARPAR